MLILVKGLSLYFKIYFRLGGIVVDFCIFILLNNISRNIKKLYLGRLLKDDFLFYLKRNKYKNFIEFFMIGNSYYILIFVFFFLNYW